MAAAKGELSVGKGRRINIEMHNSVTARIECLGSDGKTFSRRPLHRLKVMRAEKEPFGPMDGKMAHEKTEEKAKNLRESTL